jgi:hypothetical protein
MSEAASEDSTSTPTHALPTAVEGFSLANHAEFVFIRGVGATVVGALGTVINIIAIFLIRNHGATTAQNRLMINLAANNIFFSSVLLPYMSFSHFASERIPRGPPCVLFAYAVHVIQGMAVLSLLLISLNRFFVILYSKDRRFTFGARKRTLAILATSWLLTMLLLAPPAAGLWGQYGYETRFGVCTLIRSQLRPVKLFNLAITLLAFVLPLGGMIGCYARILCAVRKQGRRINHGALVKGHRRKEIALTWLSLRLVLAFIVVNLPFTLTITFSALERTPAFQATATVIMWCHVIVNPVLYISGDSRLRNIFLAKFSHNGTEATDLSIVS